MRIPDYGQKPTPAGTDLIPIWDNDSTAQRQRYATVTSLGFVPTKSTDSNGWTVYDYGTYKEYAISVPISADIGSGSRGGGSTIAPPAGKTTSQVHFFAGYFGTFAGHGVPGTQPNGSGNILVVLGNAYSGGTLNFTGNMEVLAKER